MPVDQLLKQVLPGDQYDWEILFAANNERPDPDPAGEPHIYLTNSAGTNLRALATGVFPAWSPDGSRVTYVGPGGPAAALYVVNADGSNQQRLTNPDADEIMPPRTTTRSFWSRSRKLLRSCATTSAIQTRR